MSPTRARSPLQKTLQNHSWSVPGSLALLDTQKEGKPPTNAAPDGALTAGGNILEFKFGDVVDFVVTNTDEGTRMSFFGFFFSHLVFCKPFLLLLLLLLLLLPKNLQKIRRRAPAPPSRAVLLGHGFGRGRRVLRGREDEARADRGERRDGEFRVEVVEFFVFFLCLCGSGGGSSERREVTGLFSLDSALDRVRAHSSDIE